MINEAQRNLNFFSSNLIFRLWRHLNSRRRKQFGMLFILIILSAFFEIVSLGAVIPFLAVITSPEDIFDQKYIQIIRDYLGLSQPKDLIIPITLAFIAAAIIAALMRVLLLWFSAKLSFSAGADLSIESYKRTLYQPYSVHVLRNSSEVVSSIMTKINSATAALNLSLSLAGAVIISLSIISVLISIDFKIALFSGFFFSFIYFLISRTSQNRITSNSKKINLGTSSSQKILQEGLGGIRDILLDGTQSLSIDSFSEQQKKLRGSQGDNYFISGSPKFIMEAFGIVLISILALFLVSTSDGAKSFIPVLGAMALGAQRLIPALQQIYVGWSGTLGHMESLKAVLELLDQHSNENSYPKDLNPLDFDQKFEMKSVYFKYSQQDQWLLENFNLSIQKGTTLGIVGETGSGKSTLIDIIMGLLEPQEGFLYSDSHRIDHKEILSWQKIIAHVPQNIFLADISIQENIAFGIQKELIDLDKVKHACKQAQIHDFIVSCNEGYETKVGEQGIRLSGGQRQRLGIARALYKNAKILILDEATSSLDSKTESSVMRSIEDLTSDLTIIIIAHRLSTIRNADSILVLNDGKMEFQGKYEEVMINSPTFKNLLAAQSE